MTWLLLGTALAGPPYHACAADPSGAIALISPSDGKVYTLVDDALRPLADLGKPQGHWVHSIISHPEGGWWVGTEPPTRVRRDGSIETGGKAEPAELWQALANRQAATARGGDVIRWEPDTSSVARHTAAGQRTALWSVSSDPAWPKGLAVVGDTVYALQNVGIRVHPLDRRPPSELAEPEREAIGICGVAGGPIHAAVYERDYRVCLLRQAADSWTELACTLAPERP